ncbi:MAG: sulfite exporter TauE/SafE family protein [Puia sp.]|nr:sulfite exporter TauE/SafE family protein [Puia sp.]
MWQVLSAGLFIGMIGSFHCIGMCGPLALALPVRDLSARGRLLAIMTYHAGRILTYSLLGLLLGSLGRRIYIAGFQQAFSIGLGLSILFVLFSQWKGLQRLVGEKRVAAARLQVLSEGLGRGLRHGITRLWQSPLKSRFLLLGMLNGLLPCGTVYLALAGALSLSSVKEAVAFMTLFGMGTLPVMLSITWFGHLIGIPLRKQMRKAIPLLMMGMAILLILRGLNLGIPFVSPLLARQPGQVVSCH